MSKITKNHLKNIVKECLVEILAEGLYPDKRKQQTKKHRLKENVLSKRNLMQSGISRQSSKVKKRNSSYLDNIKYGIDNMRSDNQSSPVGYTGQTNLTKDPVLNEILADTANTTLLEQSAAAKNKVMPLRSAGDKAARVVDASSPEDIFGEDAASKWASLAFAPTISR